MDPYASPFGAGTPLGLLNSPGAPPALDPSRIAGWAQNYMNAQGAPLNPANPAVPSAPGILNGAAPAAPVAPAAVPGQNGQMQAGNQLAQLGMNLMKGPPAPAPLPPINMARPVGPGQGVDLSRLIAAMRGQAPGMPGGAMQ